MTEAALREAAVALTGAQDVGEWHARAYAGSGEWGAAGLREVAVTLRASTP